MMELSKVLFALSSELQLEVPCSFPSMTSPFSTRFRRFILVSSFCLLDIDRIEFDWIPWLFDRVGVLFWNSRSNQLKYFEWLAEELGVKKPEDWYGVKHIDVLSKYHGSALLTRYKSSLYYALKSLYPGRFHCLVDPSEHLHKNMDGLHGCLIGLQNGSGKIQRI